LHLAFGARGAEGQNYFSQTTFLSNKEDRKCEGLWTTGDDFRSRGRRVVMLAPAR
jgi:hypothetical protein